MITESVLALVKRLQLDTLGNRLLGDENSAVRTILVQSRAMAFPFGAARPRVASARKSIYPLW